VPDSAAPADEEASENQFVAPVLALSAFAPWPDQLNAIREYLAGIEAAVNLLPVCDPITDELVIGFDPRWPEQEA
jgi:hypothetical protein